MNLLKLGQNGHVFLAVVINSKSAFSGILEGNGLKIRTHGHQHSEANPQENDHVSIQPRLHYDQITYFLAFFQ